SCTDTPGWTTSGNPALGEDCSSYVRLLWCKDGEVLDKSTVGDQYKNPEINCCACGKAGDTSDSPS
ncbi:unnamed protein product, partial [Didymodactylos carnosus]